MYLTIHAVAGALVGNYINQPLLAFIFGIISHFFLDMIPHYDTHLPRGKNGKELRKELKKSYFKRIIGLIYFDVSLTMIVAAAIFSNNANFLDKSIIWGMLGAILPDVILALSYFYQKNPILKKYSEFHSFIHYSPEKQISLVIGHITQIITLIIIIRPLV